MQTQEIKGNLARLLATENLIVEHRKVPTAMFDVDRRVLTLPMWDKASSVVYDMLVGHEVGHALFTPNEDWRNAVDCPKDFINVIEDARIEKLMKRKFPGLNKSFAGGYKELHDMDFFSVQGEDLSTFSLIDRINLHFKIGAKALVPFSIEEQLFVARTDLAETFEEVLQIASDVYEFSKQENDMQQIDVAIDPSVSESGSGNTPMSSDNQDSGEADGDEQDQDDADQESQSGGRTGGATSSTGSDLEDVRDDWYDEDGDMIDELGEEGGQTGGDTSESKTQRSFDNASENLSSREIRDPQYVEIPDTVDLDKHVVDWKKLHDWIDSQSQGTEVYLEVDQAYQAFRKQSQKEVNYLVKEFECKKSADAYARAGQSKTGVLDTTKLHTYKYNDDIFKKITVLPDGKNHGLLFLLDWSGSMSGEILATVKQLLNLTAFCKKVQIPFEVYAFTNEWIIAERAMQGIEDRDTYYSYYDKKANVEKNKVYVNDEWFHLMNFVSSRSNGKDYERMCKNLWREASYYRNYTGYQYTLGLQLSGTPLNEAIVMMNYIIPEFKKNNSLQKVNLCILSDGDACTSSYGQEVYLDHEDEYVIRARRLDWNTILRDRKTGHTYPQFEYDTVTNIFIQQLRDRNPDVNVIGFRILQGNDLSSFVGKYANFEYYAEVQKQWKKEKSAIIKNPKAYSALYAINGKSLNKEIEFDVESGAKKSDISRAFKKMLNNKSTNKKLLSSFIGYVS